MKINSLQELENEKNKNNWYGYCYLFLGIMMVVPFFVALSKFIGYNSGWQISKMIYYGTFMISSEIMIAFCFIMLNLVRNEK